MPLQNVKNVPLSLPPEFRRRTVTSAVDAAS